MGRPHSNFEGTSWGGQELIEADRRILHPQVSLQKQTLHQTDNRRIRGEIRCNPRHGSSIKSITPRFRPSMYNIVYSLFKPHGGCEQIRRRLWCHSLVCCRIEESHESRNVDSIRRGTSIRSWKDRTSVSQILEDSNFRWTAKRNYSRVNF